MSGIIEGTRPVTIELLAGREQVALQQTAADGAPQRIVLEMGQAEKLVQWLTGWLEEAMEDLVEE